MVDVSLSFLAMSNVLASPIQDISVNATQVALDLIVHSCVRIIVERYIKSHPRKCKNLPYGWVSVNNKLQV